MAFSARGRSLNRWPSGTPCSGNKKARSAQRKVHIGQRRKHSLLVNVSWFQSLPNRIFKPQCAHAAAHGWRFYESIAVPGLLPSRALFYGWTPCFAPFHGQLQAGFASVGTFGCARLFRRASRMVSWVGADHRNARSLNPLACNCDCHHFPLSSPNEEEGRGEESTIRSDTKSRRGRAGQGTRPAPQLPPFPDKKPTTRPP